MLPIEQYSKEKIGIDKKNSIIADKKRTVFVNYYTIDRIKKMSLQEYIWTPKNMNIKTFSSQLHYDLECICSMGPYANQHFGIYLKNDNSIMLSRELINLFGNNVEKAFAYQKSEIVKLLTAMRSHDYTAVINSGLDSAFKSKLLSVYFLDDYFPVCTIPRLKDYMARAYLNYDDNKDITQNVLLLVNWIKSEPVIKDYSLLLSMYFFDWLTRKQITIDGEEYKEKSKRILTRKKRLDVKKVEEDPYDELRYQKEIQSGSFEDIDSQYTPTKMPPPSPVNTKGGSKFPRNRNMALIALKRANYKCEFLDSHITFKRKINGLPYTEPHHLVPISQQYMFPDASLDVPANIVSLCCTCHNCIHYGSESNALLKVLYDARKEELRQAGIDLEYEDLLKMY